MRKPRSARACLIGYERDSIDPHPDPPPLSQGRASVGVTLIHALPCDSGGGSGWGSRRIRHAPRFVSCLLPVFLAPNLPVHAQENTFIVKLQESRSKVENDDLRKGLEAVDRKLQVDNLSMWYHRLVDPQNGDQVKLFSYGDYFMNCRFGGVGNGGWDMEYFLQVEVGYPNGPSWNLVSDVLQQGMYVFEQKDRALVDLVWPVPPPPGKEGNGGTLLVRLVKQPGGTRWAYLQVELQPTQGASLQRVRVSGYPGNTAGPPERERRAKTSKQDGNLQAGATLELNPAEEWAVAMYNRNAEEQEANLAVFLPEEVRSAHVSGVYSVGLDLFPVAGTETLHVALGFYTGTPSAEGNAGFLKEAPKIMDFLSSLKWQPDFARMVDVDSTTREYQPLLKLPGVSDRIGKEVAGLVSEVGDLQQSLLLDSQSGKPINYSRVLEFTRKIDQLRGVRDRLYEAAVQALVETI
ncbi:MAG: hypothetical protein HY318_16125 [Armatimonadetes bacterium]|nr:hypothetical protein [Armatimonadota bacterium]